MRRHAVLVILAGCNQVFDLEPTVPAPELMLADEDLDTIPDDEDNCPSMPNAMQDDDDRDEVGNVCDNCPLISNNSQSTLGDADAIGDACDPHPMSDGDCLIVFDTFSDPSGFDGRWQKATGSGIADVRPEPGFIAIVPAPDATIGFVAVGVDSAAADVQLLARVTLTTGRIAATSHTTSAGTGSYSCGLEHVTTLEDARATAGGLFLNRPVSSQPIGRTTVLRLVSERADRMLEIACRVEHGVAVGAATMTTTNFTLPTLPGGGPGFQVKHDPAEVDAIAIYQYQPGTPCPLPILR